METVARVSPATGSDITLTEPPPAASSPMDCRTTVGSVTGATGAEGTGVWKVGIVKTGSVVTVVFTMLAITL
jgi:hypothetical protein